MPRYSTKLVVFIFLIGAVCYTSIRLLNAASEMESIRHVITNRWIHLNQPRPELTDDCHHPTSSSYKYSSFPQFTTSHIDCRGLFEGVGRAIQSAELAGRKITYRMLTDHDMYSEARECGTFVLKHGYSDHVISEEERQFPIAYSILIYKDVAQLNVLLKAIYRPHNIYCIHVDGNSAAGVHMAARAVVDCFKNVFIVSKTERILYAGFSRLQADLNCMQDLTDSNSIKWKYFINLPSQVYPLKTNAEIVKILKVYNGSNDIEGITGDGMHDYRFVYKYVYTETNGTIKLKKTDKRHPPPPRNISVVKGSAYGIFSRKFVEFILNDRISNEVLDWCREIYSPDEYYWAILNHNPVINAPGGYAGNPNTKPWLATYVSWAPADPCSGRYLRDVCVYGVGDLPSFVDRPELFANKFIMSTYPITLMCMEDWIHNKTLTTIPFNMHYYLKLPFIIH